MIVKPETYKNLIAIQNGKIVKIPNVVLRKIVSIDKQNTNLTKNSICIVCNFRFLENKVNWSKKIKAFCHPFRDGSIFPNTIKKYLFSESDFCDKLITPTNSTTNKWNNKYDFVYFTLNSREGTRSKGIYILPLLNHVARKLNLKGLVIDYSKRETTKHKGTIYDEASVKIKKSIKNFKNLKVIKGHFSAEEVCSIMLSVRFIFLPSDADASPRMIVEPLVRNKPVVVNSSIYGGWKYINDNNGRFFKAPTIQDYMKYEYNSDHVDSLMCAIQEVLLLEPKNISSNFYEKWGFRNSSKKLAEIINKISHTDYRAVAFKEWKKPLKKIVKYV